MATPKEFKTHRPLDPSDPGFTIPGYKLRWISGRVRENSSTGYLWETIKKSDLDKKLVEHIERHYPGTFSSGDTIRRGSGELVLAYAKNDSVKEHRAELDRLATEQSSRSSINLNQEKIGDGKRDYAKVTEFDGQAGSIPSQFLNKK